MLKIFTFKWQTLIVVDLLWLETRSLPDPSRNGSTPSIIGDNSHDRENLVLTPRVELGRTYTTTSKPFSLVTNDDHFTSLRINRRRRLAFGISKPLETEAISPSILGCSPIDVFVQVGKEQASSPSRSFPCCSRVRLSSIVSLEIRHVPRHSLFYERTLGCRIDSVDCRWRRLGNIENASPTSSTPSPST